MRPVVIYWLFGIVVGLATLLVTKNIVAAITGGAILAATAWAVVRDK